MSMARVFRPEKIKSKKGYQTAEQVRNTLHEYVVYRSKRSSMPLWAIAEGSAEKEPQTNIITISSGSTR